MGFLLRWIINAVALWVTTKVVTGVELEAATTTRSILTLLAVALIFGLVNAIIKPIVKTLGCAFYVLTLGLIALVVNALLFMFTGWIADKLDLPFHVNGFWAAFWGAIVTGIVSWVLSLLIPDRAPKEV